MTDVDFGGVGDRPLTRERLLLPNQVSDSLSGEQCFVFLKFVMRFRTRLSFNVTAAPLSIPRPTHDCPPRLLLAFE